MTIDKSITELEILKKNTFSYMSAYQAFTTAVNIMRKYKKIEQIINETDFIQEDVIRYQMICKVVENGNIN